MSQLHAHPKMELVTVMIVIPLVMNVFQFWIQDNFLKAKGGAQKVQSLSKMETLDEDDAVFEFQQNR